MSKQQECRPSGTTCQCWFDLKSLVGNEGLCLPLCHKYNLVCLQYRHNGGAEQVILVVSKAEDA